jgi:hypothetical protein
MIAIVPMAIVGKGKVGMVLKNKGTEEQGDGYLVLPTFFVVK